MPTLADAYSITCGQFTWKTGPMTKIAFRGGHAEVLDLEGVRWCLARPDVILQPRPPYDESIDRWLESVPFPGPKARITMPDGVTLEPPDYADPDAEPEPSETPQWEIPSDQPVCFVDKNGVTRWRLNGTLIRDPSLPPVKAKGKKTKKGKKRK